MKKADFIVIGVVLAIAGVLAFFLYFVNGDSGKYVQVEVDGSVVDSYSIDDTVEKTYSYDGDENTLVIKDGEASVTDANCKDGICVNHMPIHRTGESIICLPHKLVVTIVDELDDDSEIDAVA